MSTGDALPGNLPGPLLRFSISFPANVEPLVCGQTASGCAIVTADIQQPRSPSMLKTSPQWSVWSAVSASKWFSCIFASSPPRSFSPPVDLPPIGRRPVPFRGGRSCPMVRRSIRARGRPGPLRRSGSECALVLVVLGLCRHLDGVSQPCSFHLRRSPSVGSCAIRRCSRTSASVPPASSPEVALLVDPMNDCHCRSTTSRLTNS